MTIEIGVLLTLVAGIIGVATFYFGRRSVAKKDGEEWGELKSDIRHIKDDVQEIKMDVKDTRAGYMQEITDLDKKIAASIRRIHNRIDAHEEKFHNKIITRDEDSEV